MATHPASTYFTRANATTKITLAAHRYEYALSPPPLSPIHMLPCIKQAAPNEDPRQIQKRKIKIGGPPPEHHSSPRCNDLTNHDLTKSPRATVRTVNRSAQKFLAAKSLPNPCRTSTCNSPQKSRAHKRASTPLQGTPPPRQDKVPNA